MAGLFSGTEERRIDTGGAEIFVRIGGEGPPLLLMHGFPQSHAMWHRVAPALMARFTCIMPDLRGYGRSSCPPNTPDNSAYSKRTMAADMIAVMAALGHRRFLVVGHDRGGRVAYRMALDRPDVVAALAVLDIVPTYAMWHGLSAQFAIKIYHWMFLAQPAPVPEMLIGAAARGWLDLKLASWAKAKDLSVFHPEALADYRDSFAREANIHAQCNDYRAGATYDLAADEADRAAGRKIAAPTLALWGTAGIPAAASGPLPTWREWCDDVSGAGVDAGHFPVEENPEGTLQHLLPFLERHIGRVSG